MKTKPTHNSSNYFKEGNFFFKTLRLLNLLEPGHAVVSLSKTLVIIMMFMFVFLTIYHSDRLAVIIPAGAGLVVTMLNYGYRRHMQQREMLIKGTSSSSTSTSTSTDTGLAPDPD